jgi:hypothetical protein
MPETAIHGFTLAATSRRLSHSRIWFLADWRQERPPPEFQRRPHTCMCAIGPHVVAELCERGEHAFHAKQKDGTYQSGRRTP